MEIGGTGGTTLYTSLAAAITAFNTYLDTTVGARSIVKPPTLTAQTTIDTDVQFIAGYDISISWSTFGGPTDDFLIPGLRLCIGSASTSNLGDVYTSINTALAAEISLQQSHTPPYIGVNLVGQDALEFAADNLFAAVVVIELNNVIIRI